MAEKGHVLRTCSSRGGGEVLQGIEEELVSGLELVCRKTKELASAARSELKESRKENERVFHCV